jgi:hypothetical protein
MASGLSEIRKLMRITRQLFLHSHISVSCQSYRPNRLKKINYWVTVLQLELLM